MVVLKLLYMSRGVVVIPLLCNWAGIQTDKNYKS